MDNKRFLEQYNGIVTRIQLVEENGNRINYMFELESLKVNVKKSNDDEYTTSLNIGDKFHFTDKHFEITGIRTSFKNKTDVDWMDYGTNVYGIDELLPFSFTVTYVVKEIITK
ncbi:hypothetical protein [Mucilaginibacter sp.]|uniref:hypothetical protein n=1 Tax=Mucilaginibacter sp. TaxID=1882438 RepID=UPI003D0FDC39